MMMLGFILLVVILYCWNSSANSRGSSCIDHQFGLNTSLEILNERYARGEIQREDYLARKQELYIQKQPISIKKG
ncbi:SHOCT domain-containing protein [Desulfosporosinus hippei]|uniref:Putative membrane protein n=1 Tax=Desulfosporosinus hippei DSM 8344 TaxID=1121419 RepID=A0A1G7TA19_9FIRM|nr:SHOCT domain-containing protein [Desulfosporosinus hippei]SDG32138.1 putative membrane protein [Desulfosporosinus hippei DSM 8344]